MLDDIQTGDNLDISAVKELPSVDAIPRDDLGTHFKKHFFGEIFDFCKAHNLPFAFGLNWWSPGQQDALLDVANRRGLRFSSSRYEPSASCQECFEQDEVNFALTVGYLQEIFSFNIGRGVMERNPIFKWMEFQYQAIQGAVAEWLNTASLDFIMDNTDEDARARYEEYAATTRDLAPEAFNQPNYGMLELEQDHEMQIMLMNVVKRRQTIVGSTYVAPILRDPADEKLRIQDRRADLPVYKLERAQSTTQTREVGYILEIAYDVLRDPQVAIEAVAEVQRIKAFQTENAIIDDGIGKIASSAKAVALSEELTRKDVIRFHLQPDPKSGIQITTMVGSLDFIVEYAGTDIFFQSSNQTPLTPAGRNFIDKLTGLQAIGRRAVEDVPSLDDSSNPKKPKGVGFDHRQCLLHVVERGGQISETQREGRNRQVAITNTYNFENHKCEALKKSAWLATLG